MGVDRSIEGSVAVAGERIPADAPPAARKLSVGLVPEDRHADGTFAQLSVRGNPSIAALAQFCCMGHVHEGEKKRRVSHWLIARACVHPTRSRKSSSSAAATSKRRF